MQCPISLVQAIRHGAIAPGGCHLVNGADLQGDGVDGIAQLMSSHAKQLLARRHLCLQIPDAAKQVLKLSRILRRGLCLSIVSFGSHPASRVSHRATRQPIAQALHLASPM